MSRREALDKAIQFVTSGKLPPQLQATPQLIVETAEKFHAFLNQDPEPEKDREPTREPSADVTF